MSIPQYDTYAIIFLLPCRSYYDKFSSPPCRYGLMLMPPLLTPADATLFARLRAAMNRVAAAFHAAHCRCDIIFASFILRLLFHMLLSLLYPRQTCCALFRHFIYAPPPTLLFIRFHAILLRL